MTDTDDNSDLVADVDPDTLIRIVRSELKNGKASGIDNVCNDIVKKAIGTYYLLTGCKGRTTKYKPKVFHTARACEGCLENQGLVFPGTARAPS